MDCVKGFKIMNSFKCDKLFIMYWYKFEGGVGILMFD